MKHFSLLFLFVSAITSFSWGQSFSVTPACNTDVQTEGVFFGAGVSFADFNGDGWPDLTFCEYDQVVCYDNQEGLCIPLDLGIELDFDASQPVWVDFDNDGDRDLFVTQYQGRDRLFENDGNFNLTDISEAAGLPDFPGPSFGQSWADYDNDGDLDVFIGKYIFDLDLDNPYLFHYYNHAYQNNGDGTFTNVTVTSGLSDGLSMTLGSTWIDYNKDGWLDLFCVNDMEDPNRLYHNNGDGTFTDVGETSGAAMAEMDAMTATAGDFNNDGWEDLFITNIAIEKCALLLNKQDGTFENIAADAGVELDAYTWGSNFVDVDLDGDLDLYVSEYHFDSPGLPNFMLRNNGDSTFTDIATAAFPGDQNDSYSVASADWNHDGRVDFALSNLSPQSATVWEADFEQGRFLSIDPIGVVSNIEGVGVTIECWVGDLYQYRLTKLGEHYLAQDSDAEHFGFGLATAVDSVRLSWPSGMVDTWYDVDINQHLMLEEGTSFLVQVSSDVAAICPGGVAVLEATSPNAITWGNGETGGQIQVDAPGWYVASSTNQMGVVFQDSIQILALTPLQPDWNITEPDCHGEQGSAVVVNQVDFEAILWPDGISGDALFAGMVQLEFTDVQGCIFDHSLTLSEPDSLFAAAMISQVACYGESNGAAELVISGGTEPYEVSGVALPLNNLSAGEYTAEVTDDHECAFSLPFTITQPDSLVVTLEVDCSELQALAEIEIEGGSPPYDIFWSDGSSELDLVGNLGEAYTVMITDSLGCQIDDGFLCTVGIEEFTQSIRLFPNPSNGEVRIHGLRSCETVRLTALSGQVIRETRICNGQWLPLEGVIPGVYLLQGSFGVYRLLLKR